MTERSYRQYCGVARALDLVGERWALLVVRELVLGPKRFTDLQNGLPGIGTNILAARLRQLERGGVVRRRTLPPPAASAVYELTGYGRELEEIVLALGRWGAKTLGMREPGEALRGEWLAVALRAFFRPEQAHGVHETYELRLGPDAFHAVVDDGSLNVGSGPASEPDLVLEADVDTMLALLGGALTPTEAVATGAVRARGDLELLERLPALFAIREPTLS